MGDSRAGYHFARCAASEAEPGNAKLSPLMPYLVDGSNLIGFLPGYALSRSRDRERLLRDLLRVPEVRRRGLVLVHDGSSPRGRGRDRLAPDVEIEWSGPRMDADTLIRHRIDKADPNHWILVTDDRELRDYARIHRVRSIGCAEMSRMLRESLEETEPAGPPEPPEKRSGRLSSDDVEDWLDWFGEGSDEDEG